MFSISTDFAPPFKLIVPYFMIGTIIYLFSTILTLGFNINEMSYLDSSVLAWVHLFLLGFAMMIIFGAMAQLIPVVLEVGHWAVELFYIIWPLLVIGVVLMVFGFYLSPALLPYGGTIVLVAISIFTLNVFVTLKKVTTFSLVVKTVIISNIFLLIGLVFGIAMALTFAGTLNVDVMALLSAHVYLIVGGYIGVTIMGLSLVLLPMFGLSHNFSQKPITYAVYLLSASIVIVTVSALFNLELIKYVGYVFQDPNVHLFADSVEEEITFMMQNLGFASESIEESLEKMLKQFNLNYCRYAYPRSLSTGEKQRVALSSVLAANPQLLILDEPTAALGVKESRSALDLIKILKEHGMSVIIISHNLQHIFNVVDRIMVLRRGEKVGVRNKHEITASKIVSMITGAEVLEKV